MKRFQHLFLALLLLSSLSACEKALLRPEAKVTNLAVFDDFATVFREKYGMFEQKDVDWIALTDSVRATIQPETTTEELAAKMGAMVTRLRDAHSSLETPDDIYSFDFITSGEENFDLDTWSKFYGFEKETSTIAAPTAFAQILDDNVGYIYIASFVGFEEETLNKLLTAVRDTRGLIIDLRLNLGGDPVEAGSLARRLTRTGYPAGTEFFKIGPAAGAFNENPINVTPMPEDEGVTYHDRPVAILQAQQTYSAASTAVYLTDPNPLVATFGSHSGGGTGSVASGYLLNGWIYNLSVSDYIDANGRRIDNGVPADFSVWVDAADQLQDEVIEAAREWIKR